MQKNKFDTNHLNYIEVKPNTNSDIVLIGLHGLGDSATGFSFLANELGDNFHYFFPFAPLDYFNVGYAWYMMNKGLDGQSEDIKKSQEIFDKFLKHIIKVHKLENKKIFLFGFSQGAVMTLIYSLKNPNYFSGAIPLSGYIFQKEDLEISNDAKKLEYLIVHGKQDDIVSLDNYFAGNKINEFLKDKVKNVSYNEFDMAHEINHDVIELMKKWINKISNS
ncbi:hypothetical protein HOD20_06175 [archaeon]|jgi:phospholipase/carboxylesterase|nr:hypothetical protein [archaeon]MBT4648011.1 hypothetical protein [archaeon]MBT6821703.1 hypothetical protein [archaeon]MBT7391472.1 hypothetical protein [archaeon]